MTGGLFLSGQVSPESRTLSRILARRIEMLKLGNVYLKPVFGWLGSDGNEG